MDNSSVFTFSFEEKHHFEDTVEYSSSAPTEIFEKAVSSVKSRSGSYISSASLLAGIHNEAQDVCKRTQKQDLLFKTTMTELRNRAQTKELQNTILKLNHALVTMELLYKKTKTHSDWYTKFWEAME